MQHLLAGIAVFEMTYIFATGREILLEASATDSNLWNFLTIRIPYFRALCILY